MANGQNPSLTPNSNAQQQQQQPQKGPDRQPPQQQQQMPPEGKNQHGGPGMPLPEEVTAPPSSPDRFHIVDPRTGRPDRKHPKHGMLTRSGMEQVIRNGGSVSHEGRLITSISDLPTQSELVAGHIELSAPVVDDLKRQRDELDAQIEQAEKKR